MSSDTFRLSRATAAYVTAVVCVGSGALAHSLWSLYVHPIGFDWLLLGALTLLSGSFTVRVPQVASYISVSETFVILSVLLYGFAPATVIVAFEALVISLWLVRDPNAAYRVFFNMACGAISIWVASLLFTSILGVQPLSQHPRTLSDILLPIALLTTCYFLLNSWLTAFAIALQGRLSPVRVWREHFAWLSLNSFGGASVAALLVPQTQHINFSTLGLILPLLVISYLTFKTAMGRVEDSNRHLSELNRLHLSTIETLAMAIDAKDQITHGHIRRVQQYAVGLAKRIGVADEKLIRAIEAAALLHDMGKLAVPEYILNKPGALTPAEFEKMKLHASVGADILTAIDFPYPVVPIVRHHHENWDGSGYPAGLKQTEIPIGARILSVVDCFDALTSDRPYRPRLSDDEALRIVLDRRGSMYDPLIVDAFVRVHREITPEPLPTGPARHALREITSSSQTSLTSIDLPQFGQIAASAGEMLTLYELARALGGQASIGDTGDVIARHIRHLIPSNLCVFYSYDARKDELEAKHAMGQGAAIIKGLRIVLGQRLSGWVGANRQSILNSDPVLDLGEVARSATPRLRSCLSTPLLLGDELVGVLSLYSAVANGFAEDHRRIIEIVAPQIARAFKRANDFDSSPSADVLNGVPNLKHLEQFAEITPAPRATRLGLLFIDVIRLREISALHGREAGDEVLRRVVFHARSCLRPGDILFRYGGNEFVGFLNDIDSDTAERLAQQVRDDIQKAALLPGSNRTIKVDVQIAMVGVPQEGQSLGDLIRLAHHRVKRELPHDESTIH